METRNVPVLIVGAGPVGLCASLLLSRHGIASELIEKHPGTSLHPRARGINVRSMEILRSLGLEAAVRRLGAALDPNHLFLAVESLSGREWKRFSLRGDEALIEALSPTIYGHCAQDDLEAHLVEEARKQAGARLCFGEELGALVEDGDGVLAIIADRAKGTTRAVRAQYVIGADGARSTVRRLLGVATQGPGKLAEYVNIYFRGDLSQLAAQRPFIICAIKSGDFAGLLLPVNNSDRWLLNVPAPTAADGTPGSFSDEECRALVRRATGVADLEVTVLSAMRWTAAAEVAERFQVGRVFLAGDAAHVMPPAGAFGMNTGIHDIHNLAWKLAAVVRGAAAPSLLASYQAERRPVAWFTAIEAARRMRELGVTGDLRQAYRVASGASDTFGEETAHDLVVALGYRYASTAVVSERGDDQPFPLAQPELGGKAGTRAPHVWLARGAAGERLSTLDLFGDGFVVLSAGRAFTDAARRLGITGYRIAADGDLRTIDGVDFARAFGIGATGAVLVRPDGFVALQVIAADGDEERILAEALARVCGLSAPPAMAEAVAHV